MHETINHQIMNNEIPTGKLNNDDTQSNEKDIIANHLLIIFIDNRAIIIAQQSNMNMIWAVFFSIAVYVFPVYLCSSHTEHQRQNMDCEYERLFQFDNRFDTRSTRTFALRHDYNHLTHLLCSTDDIPDWVYYLHSRPLLIR